MSDSSHSSDSSRPSKLDPTEVRDALASLPGWALEGDKLVRRFTFPDFKEAMKFVNRVAESAEIAQHHPDIDIRYSRVRLALVTHDAGGISRKDISMARSIAEMA
jgi:4a-hydroxytetrahydrobiopterin dehydratase